MKISAGEEVLLATTMDVRACEHRKSVGSGHDSEVMRFEARWALSLTLMGRMKTIYLLAQCRNRVETPSQRSDGLDEP